MRRNIINAARIEGDLDLSLVVTRIYGDDTRAWGDIISPGGKIPGGSDQDIEEQSATQNYHIGTRRVRDDRVFHYSYAISALQGQRYAFNSNPRTAYNWGTMTIAAAAGARYVDIPHTTATANLFQGGYFWGQTGVPSTYFQHRRVVSNDASTGVYTRCYLDRALTHAMSIGDNYDIRMSPWSYVADGAWASDPVHPGNLGAHAPAVGMPLEAITAQRYIWLQTWGPTQGTMAGSQAGPNSFDIDLYVQQDGAMFLGHEAGITTVSRQRIGFILPHTGGALGNSQYHCMQIWP